jgi:hypothetical protein
VEEALGLGEAACVLERGSFDSSEAAELIEYCNSRFKPAWTPSQMPGLDWVVGLVGGLKSFWPMKGLVDPSVRIVAFFTKKADRQRFAVNAEARAVPFLSNSGQPTFVVAITLDGLPLIYKTAQILVETLQEVKGPEAFPESGLAATDVCAQNALLFLILHEFAHVLRYHHGKLEEAMEANPVTGSQLRRVLEHDADLSAIAFLCSYLELKAKAHSGLAGSVSKGDHDATQRAVAEFLRYRAKWFTMGLRGCVDICSAIARDLREHGSDEDGSHLPLTRLTVLAQCLHSERLALEGETLPWYLDVFALLFERARVFENLGVAFTHERERADEKELSSNTIPRHLELVADGNLDSYILARRNEALKTFDNATATSSYLEAALASAVTAEFAQTLSKDPSLLKEFGDDGVSFGFTVPAGFGSFRWAIRDEDIKLLESVIAGVTSTGVVGIVTDWGHTPIPLAVAVTIVGNLFVFFRRISRRGVVLEELEFQVLHALRSSPSGLTLDDIEGRFAYLRLQYDRAAIEGALRALKERRLTGGIVVALAQQAADLRWSAAEV